MLKQPRLLVPFALERRVFQSSLINGLISDWKMDEPSSGTGAVTRKDSVLASANDLTDHNNCASATGILNNAAATSPTGSKYLSAANNASLQTGNIDWTFGAWVNFVTLASSYVVAGKCSAVGTQSALEWVLWVRAQTGNPSNLVLEARVGNGSSNSALQHAQVLATGVWYFAVLWHDSVAQTVNLLVNDSSLASTGDVGTPQTTTSALGIGAPGNGQTGQIADAHIDEAGFWKRVLSSSERSLLYNSGAGKSYPFL